MTMKKLIALALLSSFAIAAPVVACEGKKNKDKGGQHGMKEGTKGKSKAKSKIGPDAIALKEGEGKNTKKP